MKSKQFLWEGRPSYLEGDLDVLNRPAYRIVTMVNGEWCTQDSVIFDVDTTFLYEEVTRLGYQICQEAKHETEDEFERVTELSDIEITNHVLNILKERMRLCINEC